MKNVTVDQIEDVNEMVIETEEENKTVELFNDVEAIEDVKTVENEELGEEIIINRTTAIEKASTPKTIKWIIKNKGKLRFDLAIQRNKVWDDEKKSLFIHSIMYGYPFPPAYAQDSNDGLLWLLDGKQRLTTLIDYVGGDFELHDNTPSIFGFELAGLTFSELPTQLQDEILDTHFTIWQMKNMTQDERDEMFFRLNNGEALQKIELTRALASSRLMDDVKQISELDFFSDKIKLTDKQRNRFVDQELILQIVSLLSGKNNGFGGKQIREFVLELKEQDGAINTDVLGKIYTSSVYLQEAFKDFTDKECKKALKKIHVPMIFIVAIDAMSQEITAELFGKFIKEFLINDYKVGSVYGGACSAGSAKKENVNKRIIEMQKGFGKFLAKNIKIEGEAQIASSEE
jgi:hypothetical protein